MRSLGSPDSNEIASPKSDKSLAEVMRVRTDATVAWLRSKRCRSEATEGPLKRGQLIRLNLISHLLWDLTYKKAASLKLSFQRQDCRLTLREGIAEYRSYLRAIERKAMVDREGSRLILEHDATHVIFGLDTTLEQEAGLDTWLLFGCQFKWRYLRGYSQLPEIKALYKALVVDRGWRLFPQLYWKCLGLKWRIFRRTRRMRQEWPFQFPEEWLDESIAILRERHGIQILSDAERDTGDVLQWSGQY
jgi:hypothetical protein